MFKRRRLLYNRINRMFIYILLLSKMTLTLTFDRKKTRNSLFRDVLIANQSK